MMPNPATRSFLSWGKDPLNINLMKSNPVSDNYIDNLRLLIGWLFGTEGISRVISAQGADRPKLQKILAHNAATETLINTGNFHQAAAKANLDVDSWRSRLIKNEEQTTSLLVDFPKIQSRLKKSQIKDAIDRCGTMKTTHSALLTLLENNEN